MEIELFNININNIGDESFYLDIKDETDDKSICFCW